MLASKPSGSISELAMSGESQDSQHKIISGLAVSTIVWSSGFLFLIDWQFIIKIQIGWFKLGCLRPSMLYTNWERLCCWWPNINRGWTVRDWQGIKTIARINQAHCIKQRGWEVWHASFEAFPCQTPIQGFVVDFIHGRIHILAVNMVPYIAWVTDKGPVIPANTGLTYTTWKLSRTKGFRTEV